MPKKLSYKQSLDRMKAINTELEHRIRDNIYIDCRMTHAIEKFGNQLKQYQISNPKYNHEIIKLMDKINSNINTNKKNNNEMPFDKYNQTIQSGGGVNQNTQLIQNFINLTSFDVKEQLNKSNQTNELIITI